MSGRMFWLWRADGDFLLVSMMMKMWLDTEAGHVICLETSEDECTINSACHVQHNWAEFPVQRSKIKFIIISLTFP